jgi:hypothetical protein
MPSRLSPDGNEILFTSDRDGGYQIYAVIAPADLTLSWGNFAPAVGAQKPAAQ